MYCLEVYVFFFPKIIASCSSQSTETSASSESSVELNTNATTSTSSTNSISSSTTRQKLLPSVTPNPKVKKRGSSQTTTNSSAKIKKSAHAGNVQNVNSSREALTQEGSDQQVFKHGSLLSVSKSLFESRHVPMNYSFNYQNLRLLAMAINQKILSTRTLVHLPSKNR